MIVTASEIEWLIKTNFYKQRILTFPPLNFSNDLHIYTYGHNGENHKH